MSTKSSLVTRRLYRNLLRTCKPFTAPSPNAAVLTCLLHRSGIDDHIKDWDAFVSKDLEKNKTKDQTSVDSGMSMQDRARDLSHSYGDRTIPTDAASTIFSSMITPTSSSNRTYQRLFRRLLREVVTGTNGFGKMIFPSQADTTRLKMLIQREFRANNNNETTTTAAAATAASAHFDDATRQKVAFTALRELSKKLSYCEWLTQNSPEPIPQQSAARVSSLPIHPPASYLRPGVFLVSHPYMHDGYFSKSVICILEHKGLGSVLENSRYSTSTRTSTIKDGDDDDDGNGDNNGDNNGEDEEKEESDRITRRSARRTSPPGQTYGVIVNRVSLQNDTGQNRTLREVFREHMLPARMADVFGDSVVREGGPVHVALQMIHSLPSMPSEPSASDVGGTVIPFIPEGDESPALYSDKATYFQGNMFKTMSQVENGTMGCGEFCFIIFLFR